MNAKSIFKSRTALLAMLTAILGTLGFLSTDAEQFLQTHAAGLLSLLGLLNLLLRRITHGRVEFFPAEPYDFNSGHGH